MRGAILVLFLASVACAQTPPQPGFYGDVQMLWFDSEYNSDFELAPRFIAGYDGEAIGARVRYWTFDHSSFFSVPIVGSSSGYDRTQRLDFDVIDLEATTHLRAGSSDFLVSGGARIARIEHNRDQINTSPFDLDAGTFITETHHFGERVNLGGVTFAAEGRTNIISTLSGVYGGRLSVLQGDWSDWAGPQPKETFLVPEVFAGIEAQMGHFFTRMTIEFQEWNGRIRVGNGDGAPAGHDFGFTGYGFDLGCLF